MLKTRSHFDIIENVMTGAVLGENLKRTVICKILTKTKCIYNVIPTQDLLKKLALPII